MENTSGFFEASLAAVNGNGSHKLDISRRQMNLLRVISLLDAAMLIPLVIAAVKHNEEVIDVLGPTHGILFVVLIGLLFVWRDRGLWGAPFVLTVAVFGPLASIVGLERYSQRLAASD